MDDRELFEYWRIIGDKRDLRELILLIEGDNQFFGVFAEKDLVLVLKKKNRMCGTMTEDLLYFSNSIKLS